MIASKEDDIYPAKDNKMARKTKDLKKGPTSSSATGNGAHKAARATGIEPRFGGNIGRKMDLTSKDDAILLKTMRSG